MKEILNRQAEYESNARSYPRRFPVALTSAQGLYVTTTEGKTLIDCLCGAGTLALGHNHPEIIAALREVLDSGLPLHTLDIATPVKDKFVQILFESLPAELSRNGKIQFCGPTGADAVEAAIKLAKTATGRQNVIAFHGAYHGQTHGALALMGNISTKEPISGLMPGVHFFPFPYSYRCPFGLGGTTGERAIENYIRNTLLDPESGIEKPAAVIVEAVQGEGGVIPAPDGFLRALRKVTEELGIVLILDEIQAGMGRTGTMWAFEPAGIVPDIVVMSKAIGGSLPLAVMVYRAELDVWKPGAHTGTFRGNQMAMAAGTVVLQTLMQNGFLANVQKNGAEFAGWLREFAQKNPALGDVRGRGLMIGVEIVDRAKQVNQLGSYPGDGGRASRIQKSCLEKGLIVELGGRNGAVVRFLPPLNITRAQLLEVFEIFQSAVKESES